MRLVVVLTCFNRKSQTLQCLRNLEVSASAAGTQLEALLVDDASTDGTAVAVQEAFAWVTVLASPGNLYWNRSMHQGMALALQREADAILWLNDDTQLLPTALASLWQQALALQAQQPRAKPVLLVGATQDRDGRISYGGARRISRWRLTTYRRVWSAEQALACDVMNGNCVLLPMALARDVGNLDPQYEHAMGDTDYALRAAAKGYPVFAAAGVVGRCDTNPTAGRYTDTRLSLLQRWRAVMHRKGLPWRSWLHFTRQHTGLWWPLYFVWPYARLVFSALKHLRLRA
jgi:GT2 family glycosyltransferase